MRCRRARESLAIDAADKPKANVCVTLPTSASASVPLPSVLFGTESRAAALPWNPDVSNVRACHLFRFVSGEPAPLDCSLNAELVRPCS